MQVQAQFHINNSFVSSTYFLPRLKHLGCVLFTSCRWHKSWEHKKCVKTSLVRQKMDMFRYSLYIFGLLHKRCGIYEDYGYIPTLLFPNHLSCYRNLIFVVIPLMCHLTFDFMSFCQRLILIFDICFNFISYLNKDWNGVRFIDKSV